MVHDGGFLQSDFEFEAETGLFTSVWIDSRSTRMSLHASEEKFDGKQIVHQQHSLAQEAPERLAMEQVLTRM